MEGMIERNGETVTIHNYEQVDTDEYGDPVYSESTVETKAIVELTRQPRGQSDQLGTRPAAAPVIYVPESVETTDQLQSTRSTEISRHKDNTRFEVLYSFNEGNGIIKLDCEQR